MSPAVRTLRLIQIVCLLFVIGCVVAIGHVDSGGQLSVVIQYGVVMFAAWTAYSGFTMQQKLVKARPQMQRGKTAKRQSTPFTRWRAGHSMRLASAVSVGLWGFCLHVIGGNPWVVDALFAASIVLLLLWQPGKSPNPRHSQL